MPYRPPSFRPHWAPPPGNYVPDRVRYAPHQRWYKLQRWRNVRHVQLLQAPLCAECQRAKPPRVTMADTVHHVIPHKGDPALFWDATNLESVCKRCHDTVIQSREQSKWKDLE